jgi:hypothetical protein
MIVTKSKNDYAFRPFEEYEPLKAIFEGVQSQNSDSVRAKRSVSKGKTMSFVM